MIFLDNINIKDFIFYKIRVCLNRKGDKMQKIKLKSQKGAISLFVMLSMLFFLMFMLGAYTIVSRRNQAQIEATTQLRTIYSSSATDQTSKYNEKFAKTDEVIPISNATEFSLIGTGNSFSKDGKIYTCEATKKYQLTNDIIIDIDNDIVGKTFNFNEYLLYGGKIGSTSVSVDTAGYDVFYYKGNAYWKCLLYQNISDTSSVFTSSNVKNNKTSKNAYSCLNELETNETSYKLSSKFEFLLMYDTSLTDKTFKANRYNRWTQTQNPLSVTEVPSGTTNLGASLTDIKLTGGKTFGGLALSTSACFLNGDLSSSWYFAVGTYTKWNNGIPADNSSTATSQCLLFVRIK